MPELTEKQRGMELLRSSQRFVIVLPSADLLDPLAVGVVLGQTLATVGGHVQYIRSAPLPAFFARVGVSPEMTTSVAASRDYQIVIQSPGVTMAELSHLQTESGYTIKFTATSGVIRPEELTLSEVGQIDLLILVGLEVVPEELIEFGSVPQLFINSRRINSSAVQLADESASSLSELMVGIIEGVSGSATLKPELATLLLSGLLSATESFRGPTTTAKSLTVAAQLTAAGADRKLAFSTSLELHSIATLKLWGRLLSRLTLLPVERFAWSYVTREDLIASQTSEVDVPRAIDELLQSVEGTDLVVVLLQETSRIIGFVRRLGGGVTAKEVAERLQETGSELSGDEEEAYFSVDGRLIDRGRELIAKLSGSPTTDVESSATSAMAHPA